MTLLTVRGLSAFYGDFQALFGISLDVTEGQTVAVIGANGAGKTTFLCALAGALPVPRGAVQFAGRQVGGRPAHALVDLGIVLVPEGRKIFPSLSVRENLQIGAYRRRAGPWTLDRVYRTFPVLGERRDLARQPSAIQKPGPAVIFTDPDYDSLGEPGSAKAATAMPAADCRRGYALETRGQSFRRLPGFAREVRVPQFSQLQILPIPGNRTSHSFVIE